MMAPVKFIGRTTYQRGKRLFDILCRLKDFGVGRIVYKNVYYERYPEPSYYIITKVDPDMSDPTQAAIDYKVRSVAYGMKVFRGEQHGEWPIPKAYQNDWRLVPREQETEFLNHSVPQRPIKILPDSVRFPPLLELLITEEQRRGGTFTGASPMLPLILKPKSRAMTETEAKRRAAE